ncbi:site-2 protease family protein [Glaciihabitans sp. UYNi722]|uniref:M50 family metallopeptidase n=1 Tax=Glaciihabitans sp. UYNi722 TaxID=3156344 RepID=UPI003394DEEC
METVLLYVLGVVIVAVGIALSIALHEIGHLVPAKLFKVRVGQYMIGFGPTIFSRKKGETEYGVKAIPMGGYISMAGMYPPQRKGGKPRASGTDAFVAEAEYEDAGRTSSTGFFQTLVQDARTASAETIPEGSEDRVFYKLPVVKRVIIMLGGPFMNLVIAVVLFAVVISGFGTQQISTTINTVSACVLPATSDRQKCASSDPEAPAAAAGLKPGDTIQSIDGTPATSYAQTSKLIRSSGGKELTIAVLRDGKPLTVKATPTLSEQSVADAQGQPVKGADGKLVTKKVGILGFTWAYELQQQPLTAVLPAVGNNIGQDFHLILNLPQRLIDVAKAAFGSGARDPNGPVGVVGVGRLAGEVAATNSVSLSQRLSTLIGIVASVNVALLVFNLVPLMPLDGGHVAAALWEGIRRFFAKLFKRRDPGPVDAARIIPLTFAVVIILGGMSLLLLYADIVKPITL